MSGLTGKKNSTLKKEQVKESKLLTTGVKSIKFWHEASAGETSIPFGSLNMPADVAVNGFSNPTSTEILAASLALFHTNVEVFSSLNQKLMEGLTYVVKNSQIKFVNGYEAAEGEIFEVNYKNDVITGTNVVDARPLTATGVLALGGTDFNVGEAFKTNANPNSQLGEVLVFKDGILQFRNVGNATAAPAADGNYQEVASSGGFGVIIRFNEAETYDTNIIVTSRNLIAERPDISMIQLIENLEGQLDAVVPTVAALAGVPETDFRAAPNQVDLKAFGDKVNQNALDITTKQNILKVAYLKDVRANNVDGGTFNSGAWQTRVLNTVEGDSDIVNLNGSNQFELQPGKYVFDIEAPVRGIINTTQAKLYNVTTGIDAITGTSMIFGNADDYGNCTVRGMVIITEPTFFEVQHQCQTSKATDGFGRSTTFTVANEVYTVVKITKLS